LELHRHEYKSDGEHTFVTCLGFVSSARIHRMNERQFRLGRFEAVEVEDSSTCHARTHKDRTWEVAA
jgi:hypothetical protein